MSIHQSSFRSDLEILRGLAVILVVLFHLKISLFSSGFIGVDIFFVLSGYLMAAAFSEGATIFGFYERRARRVLPAAIVTMLIFFIVAPIFFLPFEVQKIIDSFIGILLLIPNIIYWRDNDYFAELDFTPMLHYWSLGVELQYYLVFPLMVVLFRKRQYFFVLLAIITLLASIYLTKESAKTAFFLLPTRMWEFLAGYFAFYIHTTSRLIKENRWPTGFSVLSLLCFLGLIICSIIPIPKEKFPGVYAVVPILLAASFATFGLSQRVIELIKFGPILRWAGKYSYSIYLVHYPVIFIFLYGPFSSWVTLSAVQKILALAVTILLSLVSYKYIEQPFRNRKSMNTKKFISLIIILYVISLIVMGVYSKINFFQSLYSPQEQAIFNAMNDRGAWRCSKLQKIKEFREESCYLYKNPSASKRIYLVGDSHMDALKEIFVDLAASSNVEVRLNKERCYLGEHQCSSGNIIKEVEKFKITDVVLHGYDYGKFNYSDLEKLLAWAQKHSLKVHFIGPVPTYNKLIPPALYHDFKYKDGSIPYKSLATFESEVSSKYLGFKNANMNRANVFFYSPETLLCNSGMCLLQSDTTVYYFDSHHLTMSGARVLNPIVVSIYEK